MQSNLARRIWLRSVLSLSLLSSLPFSTVSQGAPTNNSRWMDAQAALSLKYLMANVSPGGTARGVVVASPSRVLPNYWFHWIRDAALVMDVVVDLYRFSRNSNEKAYYRQGIFDFIALSRSNQTTQTLTGLGEPKFNVDGSAFNGSWGRPQNDGPALRINALVKFASVLISEGKEADVRRLLYDGGIPSHTVIKTDLEYVAHNWQNTCFDLWEEVNGRHFYTRMAQRRSLLQGGALAYHMGDKAAGDYYVLQARNLERELQRHWDANAGYIVTTLDRVGGLDYKLSNLDTSVILAVLHNYNGDGFFSASDDRVLSTFQKIEEAFRRIYPVNSKGYPAVAIGRYPEDRYSGVGFGEGNAWVLTTVGFGEFLHKAASEFTRKGRVDVTPVNQAFFQALGVAVTSRRTVTIRDALFQEIVTKLKARGDEYISRVGFHGFKDGRLSEQINRHTGYMQGAHDLTWSYASFITAFWSRSAR